MEAEVQSIGRHLVLAQALAAAFGTDLLAAGIGDGCHAFEIGLAAPRSCKASVPGRLIMPRYHRWPRPLER